MRAANYKIFFKGDIGLLSRKLKNRNIINSKAAGRRYANVSPSENEGFSNVMLGFGGGKIMQACYHLLAKNIDVSVIFSPPRQVWWKAPSRLEFWEKWWWDCPCWKDQTWCRYTIWNISPIPAGTCWVDDSFLFPVWWDMFPSFPGGVPTILSDFFFEQHWNCLDWKHMGRQNDNCGAPEHLKDPDTKTSLEWLKGIKSGWYTMV